MTSAITPPSKKYINDAARYMYPMVLWSVEVMIEASRDRCRVGRADWLGSVGVVVVGFGSVDVTDVSFLA
jgi:hypothetical protein